jgi:threonine dehydratase
MLHIGDIHDASRRINSFIHRTPLIFSRSFSELTGADVFLKAENLQRTGSFKVRGAFNKMSALKEKKVIAASMGNHAQGVAFAAQELGKDALIVMPESTPIVKQEATRGYGAEVVLHGSSFAEALDFALARKGRVFIHAYDDEAIMAGQGTVGLEILEESADIDYILVPVGGGGLISGVSVAAKYLSPRTGVIGVQTGAAPSVYTSFREKRILEIPPEPTIADGIAVGRVGDKPFEVIGKYVDDMVLVDEDSIAISILLFLERKKLVVEGAGAVTLAAMQKDKERFRGKRVVLVVSGGNIDFTLIDRIIHKGLIMSGRIGIFRVTIDDTPGSLHLITGVISEKRGNILNVRHERFSPELPVGRTRVIFTVETRGEEHLEEILSGLKSKGIAASRQ